MSKERFLSYINTNHDLINNKKVHEILDFLNLDEYFQDDLKPQSFFSTLNNKIDFNHIDKTCNLIFKNKEKKFKKIIISLDNQEDFFKKTSLMSRINLGSKLIKNKRFNKDLVFNKIKEDSDHIIFDNITLKQVDLICKNYEEKKALNFLFSPNAPYWINEISEGVKTLKSLGVKQDLSKKAKSLQELHHIIIQEIEDQRKFEVKDDPLNPREDLLLLDQKNINVLGKKLFLYVAKTRHDLCKFSSQNVFDNCVGTFDSYFKKGQMGESTFIGIFSENKKPLYCIETEKYSFAEAKGVSNSLIPKDVYYELQNLLTLTPEVPKDFIPLKHHFLFGYKYIEESQSFFLMFKNGSIYEYAGISLEVYEDFVGTETKGKFLNQVIKKNKYPCEKIY